MEKEKKKKTWETSRTVMHFSRIEKNRMLAVM